MPPKTRGGLRPRDGLRSSHRQATTVPAGKDRSTPAELPALSVPPLDVEDPDSDDSCTSNEPLDEFPPLPPPSVPLLPDSTPLPSPNSHMQATNTLSQQALLETSPTVNITPPSTPIDDKKLHVICTTSAKHANQLHSLSPAARARAIFHLVGDIEELRILRSGDLLLIAKTEDQVSVLLRQTSLADIPVRFHSPASSERVFFGVVSGVPPDASEDDIAAILQSTNATGFVRLRRRDTGGHLVNTSSLRLSFTTAPPDTVLINYVKTPIKPYIQRLLQCYKCYRYGHGVSSCRGKPRCGRCASEDHATSDCSSPSPRCALCSGDHTAWSSLCPRRQQELDFERLRATTGLSYWEAKNQLKLNQPESSAPTNPLPPPVRPANYTTPYASSLRSNIVQHMSTATNPKPVPTSSPALDCPKTPATLQIPHPQLSLTTPQPPDASAATSYPHPVQPDITAFPTSTISLLLRLLCTLLTTLSTQVPHTSLSPILPLLSSLSSILDSPHASS